MQFFEHDNETIELPYNASWEAKLLYDSQLIERTFKYIHKNNPDSFNLSQIQQYIKLIELNSHPKTPYEKLLWNTLLVFFVTENIPVEFKGSQYLNENYFRSTKVVSKIMNIEVFIQPKFIDKSSNITYTPDGLICNKKRPNKSLVIECDSYKFHSDHGYWQRDHEKDQYFEDELGLNVSRLTNKQISENPVETMIKKINYFAKLNDAKLLSKGRVVDFLHTMEDCKNHIDIEDNYDQPKEIVSIPEKVEDREFIQAYSHLQSQNKSRWDIQDLISAALWIVIIWIVFFNGWSTLDKFLSSVLLGM